LNRIPTTFGKSCAKPTTFWKSCAKPPEIFLGKVMQNLQLLGKVVQNLRKYFWEKLCKTLGGTQKILLHFSQKWN
jgi:hypothetical protein